MLPLFVFLADLVGAALIHCRWYGHIWTDLAAGFWGLFCGLGCLLVDRLPFPFGFGGWGGR